MAPVHMTPFAGSWYPNRHEELERLLASVFESSRRRTGRQLLRGAAGFVVPHAGIQYSGAVAAAAYRHLEQARVSRAILLGFSHAGGPAGPAIPDISGFVTPLGEAWVDRPAMETLGARPPFKLVDESRVCDHSIEIQLPLLQKAAPRLPVLPIYVGRMSEDERRRAAEALAALAADSVFLASSDFTHYGRAFGYEPFPCDHRVEGRLRALDGEMMEAASALDAGLFLEQLAQTGATLCGYHPIALWLCTLATLGGDLFQELLDYQTSGEMTGDFHHSVSYAALGYFPAGAWRLDEEDRALLAVSARRTLEALRSSGERVPVPPARVTPALSRRAGAFVSLHQQGRLLGCVGTRKGRESLAQDIPDLTLAAATEDPRFDTVLNVEGEIDIEISVLTPSRRIADPVRLCPGRHGAWLQCGAHAGLLLPQVATERGWQAEEFLMALSRKAGMGAHGYLDPQARVSVFEAEVFSDSAEGAAAE